MEQYPRYEKNDRFDKYSNVKFTKDGFVSEPAPSSQKPSKARATQSRLPVRVCATATRIPNPSVSRL